MKPMSLSEGNFDTFFTLHFYRPHPKDGEGNVFTLSTPGGGGGSGQSVDRGGGQVQPGREVRVKGQSGGGSGQRSIQLGGSKVNPAGEGGQVKGQSSWGGGQVQPGGGQVQLAGGGGSASCALLPAVCLLRSRRRTFLSCLFSLSVIAFVFS